jgi:hypothetical protein
MTIQYDNLNSTISAVGTETNIPINIQPKGTGGLNVLGSGQNLLLQSQNLLNAQWTNVGSSISVSATLYTAPDGTTTANNLVETATTIAHYIQNSTTITAGVVYTYSVYLKKGIGATAPDWMQLALGAAGFASPYANFNLSTGALGTTSGATSTITSVGNGWYRCSITATANQSAQTVTFPIVFTNNSNATGRLPSYTGAITSDVLVWGAQVELGSTLNTYIPTTTTAIYGTPQLTFSGVAGIGLESNGALYVSPAGTGALQAQATTSTTAGGNARGANAVDWQTDRSSATRVASGSYSVVGGGSGNYAQGSYTTVAGGNVNGVASAATYGAVLGGFNNVLGSPYAVIVGGYSNGSSTQVGQFNFIGGGALNTGTATAAVTTQAATMNATTAVTLSGSNANIKVGQYIVGTAIAVNTYVAAISGTSLTLSANASGSGTGTLSFFTPHGVVVGGGNNQATGSYSFIGGGGDAGTAANRNVASGDWSAVVGGRNNTASGYGSFVGGGGLNLNGTAAANTASGNYAFVGAGRFNVASGTDSIALGYNSLANSTQSFTVGNSATSRGINGNTVFTANNNPISGTGTSQSALLVLARQTTDATPTVLTCDLNAAGGANQVILPNNSAYFFRGEIVSGVTGGGSTKGWTIEGVIKRGANAASTALVGTPTVTSTYGDAGASTWTIAVTADTTNGGLAVTFTGQLATTIRTVAQIRTTEMTF